MPRGRKVGSTNGRSLEERIVRRILQQRDWHRNGCCIVCGAKHDENWHDKERLAEHERDMMLDAMEEGRK